MRTTVRATVGRAFRRWAIPLGCYYAVTLALPLANGAADTGHAFVSHALVVLVLPPVLIGLACTIHAGSLALRDWARYSSGGTPLTAVCPASRRSAASGSPDPANAIGVHRRPSRVRWRLRPPHHEPCPVDD